MVIWLLPREDVDVIELMPEIVDICRSITAATDDAIVSGLAPGNVALMVMVGKSTLGKAATGRSL
jgi:hypothetical protein